jgi:O-antigen/teichoic acid export membrane protein
MISLRNRIFSLSNMVLEFVLGIGLTIFITRFYSLEQAGQWFLFIAIFALASSMRDALVQSALIKGINHTEDASNASHLKTNSGIMLSVEFIICCIVLMCAYYSSGEWSYLLLYYPAYSLPNAVMRWLVYYLRGKLTLAPIFIANGLNAIILFIGLVFVTRFNLSLISIIVLLGVSSGAALYLIQFVPVRQIIDSKLSKEQFQLIKQLGIVASGREVTAAVSTRISLFITGSLLSLQHTALLGLSQRFAQVALLPNNSFQSILFPSLVHHFQKGNLEQARKQFHESISLLLAITLPVSLIGISLSPTILKLVNGAAYQHAWIYLSVYVFIATCITPFGTAFGSAMTAWGKPELTFKIVFLNSTVTIILTYIFIKTIGAFGAPLAFLLVEAAGLIQVNYLLKKICGIHLRDTIELIPGHYAHAFQKIKEQFQPYIPFLKK